MHTLAALFSLLMAGGAPPQAPALVLSIASHDFGTIRQGERVTHLFTVRNEGEVPRRIHSVDLNLPGMKVLFQPVVAPGQEVRCKLEWNTALVEGAMEGQAILRTDDPAQPRMVLTFKATVRPPVQILPLPAAFFSAFVGETAQQTLQIINHDAPPLEVRGVEPEGQHVAARLETVTAGQEFRLHVTVSEGTPPGRYMEAVSVVTNRPERPRIRVPVNILIKADLHVDPEVIDFGDVPLAALSRAPGLLNLVSRVVTLQKRDGEFEIRSITSDVGRLHIEQTPSGRARAFRIDVGLTRNRLQPGSLAGTIHIETNDPKFPQIVIPVRGQLQ